MTDIISHYFLVIVSETGLCQNVNPRYGCKRPHTACSISVARVLKWELLDNLYSSLHGLKANFRSTINTISKTANTEENGKTLVHASFISGIQCKITNA